MDGWSTLRRGPLWRMQLEAGRLETEGIRTWVPDETIQVLDPFATGALPLDTELKVRSSDLRRARRLLEDAAHDVAEAERTAPPDPDDGTPEEAALREEVETLARRTRWSALAVITFPFAVYWGARYLALCRRGGRRDDRHGLTLAAFAVGALAFTLFVGTYVVIFGLL